MGFANKISYAALAVALMAGAACSKNETPEADPGAEPRIETDAGGTGAETTPGPAPKPAPDLPPQENILLEYISATGGIEKTDTSATATGEITLNGPYGPINMGEGTLYFDLSNDGRVANVGGSVSLPGAVASNPLLLAQPGNDRYRNEAEVDASIGLMTGEEINADGRFEITLAPDRMFFVFVIESDTSGAFRLDDENPKETSFRFDLPGDASTILIADPMDHMIYKYASLDISGGYGEAYSRQGLIGFDPILGEGEFAQIWGHEYKNGEFGVGVKIFDVFGIKGEQLVRKLQPASIILNNLDADLEAKRLELDTLGMAREIQYDAAYNGELSFALSLLGADLITLKFADSTGVVRLGAEALSVDFAVRRTIDLRDTQIGGEDWFKDVPGVAFFPREEQTGTVRASDTDYLIELTGTYEYPYPGATVEGSMTLTPESLTQRGMIESNGDRLEVISVFDGDKTDVTVNLPDDSFTSDVRAQLGEAFDSYNEEYDAAFAAVDEAVANFETEASLRGLRTSVPPILRRVKTIVAGIPAKARSEAESQAEIAVKNACKTVGVGIAKTKVCATTLLTRKARDDINADAGNQAYNQAKVETDRVIEKIDTVLTALAKADDAMLREALKTALEDLHAERNFSKDIKITKTLPLGLGTKTLHEKTYKATVLTKDQADMLLKARDYVDFIPAASDRVVSARMVADQLPSVEEVADRRKAIMDEAAGSIPSLDGAGYVYQNGNYAPYLILDGKRVETGINVMNPIDLKAAFIDAIVQGF